MEIGSGTGLVGLVASALGAARVVLTDLPYVMPQLTRAIANNAGTAKGVVEALPLDWCDVQACPGARVALMARSHTAQGEPAN